MSMSSSTYGSSHVEETAIGAKRKRRKLETLHNDNCTRLLESDQRVVINLEDDGSASPERKNPNFIVKKSRTPISENGALKGIGMKCDSSQTRFTCARNLAPLLSDGGAVTLGLGPLIHNVLKERQVDYNRCHISTFLTHGALDDSIVHITQSDSWSCGYRNAQMMLCYLLPRLTSSQLPHKTHSFRKANRNKRQNSEVIDLTVDLTPVKATVPQQGAQQAHLMLGSLDLPPVISTFQEHIENSWKMEGFDPKGAEYYNNKLRNSKSRIGAVEVASLFRYWYLDATIVQFAKTSSSRHMLGPFVWAYFATNSDQEPTKNHRAYFGSQRNNSTAAEILQLAETDWKEKLAHLEIDHNTCSCCPLYLQWDGHSVLVVGIERISKTRNNSHLEEKAPEHSVDTLEFNLLIFDPAKRGCDLKAALGNILLNTGSRHHPQFLDSIKLPLKRLRDKDIQVIHCAEKILTSKERCRWKKEIRAITANGLKD